MTRLSSCLSVLAMLLALFAAPVAHASNGNCTSAQLPWRGAIVNNVQRSQAPGTPVNGTDISNAVTIDCGANWSVGEGLLCQGQPNWIIRTVTGSVESAFPGVYTYGGMPAGIGYQLLDDAGQPLPMVQTYFHDAGVPIRTGNQTIPIHLRLVKLDDSVAAGSFNLRFSILCQGNEHANATSSGSTVTLTVTTTILTPTCNLTNPDVQITLPTVPAGSFHGAGDTAGSATAALNFQCDPNADAKVNFTDAATLGNDGSVLTPLAGSTATGVGVQLSADGSVVELSPHRQFGVGATEIALKNAGAGTLIQEVPISARYVQTGASVTAGSVQARALVNIAYN